MTQRGRQPSALAKTQSGHNWRPAHFNFLRGGSAAAHDSHSPVFRFARTALESTIAASMPSVVAS